MSQPIRFGDEGLAATRSLPALLQGLDAERSQALLRMLFTLEGLDRQYGGHSALALEDTAGLVAAALTEAARIESEARRAGDGPTLGAISELIVGVALWAIRHQVALDAVEPVANALAERSNRASGKAQLAAVFALMQGVIAHVAPRLSADLERSNPERPWRVLHANLAITAIRTEDAAMMAFAFDALDAALPGEREAFYGEALALAMSPRIPRAVRDLLAERHGRWALPPPGVS
jgi:hypothetical protein